MSTSVEERLSRLEERLERLESWVQVPADRPAPRQAKPVAAKAAPAPAPPKPRPEPLPRRDLEELLGGRLLALVGGVAVLVGLTFLVALAVERGWLDEKARTVLAFIGSALLLGLGAWLHENRGRTQASLAACGTGLAGLFLSLTAATVLYDLVPVGLALAAAFVFGAIGAALAVRWDATPIGGLGILGALSAPFLTDAADNAQALLFLAIADAAAGGLGFLLLVAIHALAFEARPSSLVNGADPFWKAALVIGAVSVVAALAYRRGLGLFAEERMLLATTAGTAAVYLVSIGIVSGFQPGPSVREQGQAILSAFWSLLGLGLLRAGLRRDLRPLRLAGFALLAVAVGKVFLYDMAALDRGYRVLSFVVLGLLLLAGAYAYQRLRRDVLRTP